MLEEEFRKDSIKIEWTALVTSPNSGIQRVQDLKGKRVAVTRGTDPHIFLLRALNSTGSTEKDIELVPLQHPDGKTALEKGNVDAWAGLDPYMAQLEVDMLKQSQVIDPATDLDRVVADLIDPGFFPGEVVNK